jgi:hypothetical protein
VRVRLPPGARFVVGESRPLRSARTGWFACPRPGSSESEPVRDRASLLTTARVTPWRLSRPLSSEDEPAGRLASVGNRVGAERRCGSGPSSSAISRLFTSGGRAVVESEPARVAGVVSKTNERASVTVRVRRSPPWEGAPPARQRALNTRGGLRGHGDRHLHLPLNGHGPSGRRGRSDKAV